MLATDKGNLDVVEFRKPYKLIGPDVLNLTDEKTKRHYPDKNSNGKLSGQGVKLSAMRNARAKCEL